MAAAAVCSLGVLLLARAHPPARPLAPDQDPSFISDFINGRMADAAAAVPGKPFVLEEARTKGLAALARAAL